MEALNHWATARSHLKDAATGFLDACLALKLAVQSRPSHPNQIILEGLIDDMQSKMDSIAAVESCMHRSRATLNAMLNHSTSRVPMNKLPPEILGRIFTVIVGSTPCYLEKAGRDPLPDIPLVCDRWYQVATHTRSLWSHIDIDSRPIGVDSSIIRLQLERSHGVPLHIHVRCDPFEAGNTISKIAPILQPYKASTSSFLFSGLNPNIARALFALYLGDSGPGILSTLAISRVWDSGVTLPWPTYPIPKLTSLELCSLVGSVCPALDELVTMLSDLPNLHTLRLARLRNFSTRPGHHQNHCIISLPCLKLLEIEISGDDALAALLGMLHPGKLELHVRLGIQIIGDDPVPHTAQLLLARSNVVSLTLLCIDSDFALDIRPFFLRVPRLRALRADLLDGDVEAFLSALADCYVLELLPRLQLLCLSNGEVHSRAMGEIKSMIGARSLHSLLFWSCKFPAAFSDQGSDEEYQEEYIDLDGIPDVNVDEDQLAEAQVQVQVQDQDQDQDQDLDLGQDEDEEDVGGAGILGFQSRTPNSYFPIMPTDTEEWLLEYVERLVICEAPFDRIIDGVDVLAQEMTKIGSNNSA
ncbi:hypothetical protein FRC09_011392 [Ceratobasidium sp. 395]|nr:hypothetical protein FRC09_011392 [Ceratobasidium sp. 395]